MNKIIKTGKCGVMPTNQIIANIGKSVMFLLFFLICCPVNAQEQNGWTANDSVRLVKMLNGEISIQINDAFKRELEQSMIAHPIKDDSRHWDDFSLDLDSKEIFPNEVNMGYGTVFHNNLNHNNNLWNGHLKCKIFMINSRTDKNLPFINVQQNTNIAIPLNDKWNFDLYGGYTQYKRNSVIIPPTAIPYTIGGGFSYNVGKNMFIGTQTDYQYNILQKKWEWFCGLRFTINF